MEAGSFLQYMWYRAPLSERESLVWLLQWDIQERLSTLWYGTSATTYRVRSGKSAILSHFCLQRTGLRVGRKVI